MREMVEKQDRMVEAVLTLASAIERSTERPYPATHLPTPAIEKVARTRSRVSPQLQKTVDYLKAHSEDNGLSTRLLADKIGVSRQTVATAKKMLGIAD